jgi:hypothetical protein
MAKREAAAATVGVNPIATAAGAAWRRQGPAILGGGEAIGICRVEATGVIRRHIDRVGGQRYRCGKIYSLPAAHGLAAGRCAGKQGARQTPQIGDMRAGVLRTFVKENSEDLAGDGCFKT